MLSNSCRYGIRAVIYLASQSLPREKIGIKKISNDLNLPTPFLAKILQQLVKKKILSSTKGPHGGFSMLKDTRKITLLDIVNTIDGKEIFTNCLMHNGPCKCVDQNKKPCPIHKDYEEIRANLIELFSNKTIYELEIKANKEDNISI
ncbi:MAG: Rrf2 family transcriptional regulator [Bacteroidales bacterium]|nr:Rrf2 family transcriptional regulator [Bacteroidales bacterium]